LSLSRANGKCKPKTKRDATSEGTDDMLTLDELMRNTEYPKTEFVHMPVMKDIFKDKIDQIKLIGAAFTDVKFRFTFVEETNFQFGVLSINPEDALKDIERSFKHATRKGVNTLSDSTSETNIADCETAN